MNAVTNLHKEVDLFVPCCMDRLWPETIFQMIKLFEKLDVKLNYNPNQVCCGKEAYRGGFRSEAREIGAKFLSDFNNRRYIICPSASCVGYIKNYYMTLFQNSSNHLICQEIQANLFELCDFMVNMLRLDHLPSVFPHKVCYHDSCASLRECQIRDEPRMLLQMVEGLELVEMIHTEECCGFGGAFSVYYEPLAVAMVQKKIDSAIATGAEFIVSNDAGCLTHMNTVIRKQKLPIKAIHIVDVLASGL